MKHSAIRENSISAALFSEAGRQRGMVISSYRGVADSLTQSTINLMELLTI